jgi:glycosyltransferase involved in cell wall biosynthesis
MHLGVPAVASRIPGVEFMTGGVGARLVEMDDSRAFASVAADLLRSPQAWRKQRRQGIEAAQRFAPARVALEIEEALLWAAGAAREVSRA